MDPDFAYIELAHAEHDLKLFSSMNAHEGRCLFLVYALGGMKITQVQPDDSERIEAIALNGKMFTAA